jgi:hypothetical protein
MQTWVAALVILIAPASAQAAPVTCVDGSCTTARITPQVKAIIEKQPDRTTVQIRLYSDSGLTNADLKSLELVPWVRNLDLACEGDGCAKVTDFSPLAKLVDLEQLDATGADHFTSLAPLAGAKKLRWLRLWKVPVSDIGALKGKPLKTLQLDSSRLKSLDALAGNTTLASLTVDVEASTDVTAIGGLVTLGELSLRGGAITSSNLFAKLVKLFDLGIANKKLTEISGLAPLAQLEFLSIAAPVTDLSPIKGLAKLKHLSLRRMPATTLPALATRVLAKVDFGGTVFADLTPLAASPELWSVALAKETSPRAVEALRKLVPKVEITFDRGKGVD